MGVRVKEDGKSERHPVIGWIGVAGNPTSHHAQASRLPSGLLSRESLANHLKEGKQMSAVKKIAYTNDLYAQQTAANHSLAGAPSTPDGEWYNTNWRKVNQEVRRLQARIVKATQEGRWARSKRCSVY